ncbi:MAG: SDR family oxidoreductase [Pseudomonadota bacterium]
MTQDTGQEQTTTRTALITGSGLNIGRAIAVRLARDGMNVVINGSRDRAACDVTAQAAAEAGGATLVAMGDVGTREGARTVAVQALERFGRVDVLVTNAAIRPESAFLEMDEAEWDRVLAINLNSAFWLARACLPGMVEAGFGRIITFAGMNAIHGYKGRAHVSVSKHALWGLTKSLAKEFGPQGITTNIVSPGPIRPEGGDPAMVAHIRSQEGRIPVGRLGEASEVAATVALLASDDGAFINGQMLQVNGGTQT